MLGPACERGSRRRGRSVSSMGSADLAQHVGVALAIVTVVLGARSCRAFFWCLLTWEHDSLVTNAFGYLLTWAHQRTLRGCIASVRHGACGQGGWRCGQHAASEYKGGELRVHPCAAEVRRTTGVVQSKEAEHLSLALKDFFAVHREGARDALWVDVTCTR